jgi:hypothetical protein
MAGGKHSHNGSSPLDHGCEKRWEKDRPSCARRRSTAVPSASTSTPRTCARKASRKCASICSPHGANSRITLCLRIARRRAGYFNAVQVFSYSPGALYQIYASPGQITDMALEPGEQLTGSGPLAAGDTVRWIVGDIESGNGDTRRVHIMVKPTRPAIETNLVVNTDRRTYLIEPRSREKPYMPSVAWFYPEDRSGRSRALPPTPIIPEVDQRRYRYVIDG